MPSADVGGRPGGASMTVQQLREQLKCRGLPTTGSKAELVARYDEAAPEDQATSNAPPEEAKEHVTGDAASDDKVEDRLALTMVQLKERLKELGLSPIGTKGHLLRRYEEAVVHFKMEGRALPQTGGTAAAADATGHSAAEDVADAGDADSAAKRSCAAATDVAGTVAPRSAVAEAPAARGAHAVGQDRRRRCLGCCAGFGGQRCRCLGSGRRGRR